MRKPLDPAREASAIAAFVARAMAPDLIEKPVTEQQTADALAFVDDRAIRSLLTAAEHLLAHGTPAGDVIRMAFYTGRMLDLALDDAMTRHAESLVPRPEGATLQ